MLKLNNVEVKYLNVILVIRGVSLEVPETGIVCLLGANGAGKTTILKAISGLLHTEEGRVTEGSIDFMGQQIQNSNPELIARLGIIQVVEGGRCLEHLSVEENLLAGGAVIKQYSIVKQSLDMVYDYFPRLRELRKNVSGYISGGERQMLGIGRALMAHPKIVLLDEPSLGLAPLLVAEIFQIVRRINMEEKTAALLVEQNARAALELADYGYVMENGRVVLDGSAAGLKDNEDIKEFYLGLSSVGEKKNYKAVKHYKRRKRWL